MRDLYEILGVARDAGDDEVKKAYRKLAKELHPDVNPDDPVVADRFKEVSAAYKILGDKSTRQKYDRGEIGPDGQERSKFRYEYAGSGPGGPGGAGGQEGFGFGGFNPEDLFSEIFGNMGRRQGARRAAGPQRGSDRLFRITVDFLAAANGATRRINLPGGKTLDVKIPAGIEDGQQIRLKGLGNPGLDGGPAGDAKVEVSVSPHRHFVRDGDDIRLELPITLGEAVLGAKIEVPTIDGAVTMTIPKGANTGQTLRLKGKGIAGKGGKGRGDQLVTLKVMLPEKPDPALEEAIGKWAKSADYDVRRKLGLD